MLHEGCGLTFSGARLVAMAQGVSDFVVHQVVAVLFGVVEVFGGVYPAVGVEHDVAAVVA